MPHRPGWTDHRTETTDALDCSYSMAIVDHARRNHRIESMASETSSPAHLVFDGLDFGQQVSIANDSRVGILTVDAHVVQRFEIVLLTLLFPKAFEVLLRIAPFFILGFQSRRRRVGMLRMSDGRAYRLRTMGTATRGFRFSPSMISFARSP